MKFNEARFEAISFTKSGNNWGYVTPSNAPIKKKEVVTDLGIDVDSRLDFKPHIKKTAARGNCMANWVLRSFRTRATPALLVTLKSLIISVVEYGSVIWSPTDQHHINLLESVQRRFTSRFSCFQTENIALGFSICTTNYPDRLKQLHLFSLERRRERFMIIYIFKIINKMVPNPGLRFQYEPRRKWWVHPKYATHPTESWKMKARNTSFFVTAPRLYNSLPPQLRELEDANLVTKVHVEAFKRRLPMYLSKFPDEPGDTQNSLLSDRHRFETRVAS